jgi:hypothetical protein
VALLSSLVVACSRIPHMTMKLERWTDPAKCAVLDTPCRTELLVPTRLNRGRDLQVHQCK